MLQPAPRQLAMALAALCVVYVIAALSTHPSLYPDPAGGFLVQKSMRQGSAWNHITEPRSEDIGKDRSYFYATWSPGQYAVPGVLTDLGLPLGRALTVVCVAGSLIGLGGWVLLFRTLAFEWTVTLACGLLIAASRSFNLSFLIYDGSDLLAFMVFPFLAIAAFRLKGSWALALAAPALVVLGFFFKNSLTIYVGAWILSVAAVEALGAGVLMPAVVRVGVLAAGMAGAALVLQWAYLSRGWTPVSYHPSLSTAPARYLLPWAMPLLAATGLDDVINRVCGALGRGWRDAKISTPFLLPVAAASIAFAVSEARSRSRHPAAFAIVSCAGAVVLVFAALYATGSGASLQLGRHYLIPGFLLLPLLVRRAMLTPRRAVARAVAVALIVPCLYGAASFVSNWRRHFDQRQVHSTEVGVTHLMLTPRLLGFIRSLDRELPAGNNLVVLPGHEYALEFSRTRVLATSATSDSVETLASTRRFGTVDNLVVMAERQGLTDAATAAWLTSFASYPPDRWDFFEADGFRFYVPHDQPVTRAWLESAWALTIPGPGPTS